jgi:hypothetical protein
MVMDHIGRRSGREDGIVGQRVIVLRLLPILGEATFAHYGAIVDDTFALHGTPVVHLN